jgi:hypothetical protein
MFKKWPKPNFFISAKTHSEISQNCVRLQELDSRIVELRHMRRNVEHNEADKADRQFISCFASH